MTILNKEKILEQAKAFVEASKFDKAIKEYEKIISIDPSELRVKIRIAELHTKCKQINDAIRIYKEVANAYSEEGFFLKAVTVYKNILRLNPSLYEFNEELARLYEKMSLTEDAIKQYDIVASSMEGKAELNKALELRKRIVELKPQDTKARMKLSDLYQCVGQIDESIKESETLVKQLEEKGEEEDKRIDLYEKILSHAQDKPGFVKNLVLLYHKKGNKKKILEWLEKKSDLVEEDEQLLSIQAEIYASLNQLDSAVTKYYLLIDFYREEKETEKILDTYLKILLLMPDEKERVQKEVTEINSEAWSDLLKKWENEKKKIAEEEAKIEESEKLRLEEERIKEEAEKQNKSQRVRKKTKAIDMDPASAFKEAEAVLTLARAYRKMGLDEEFAEEIKKALSLFGQLKGQEKAFPKLKEYLEEIEKLKRG